MSFISASGLPLEVSSIDVTGSAEVHGDFACDKHFYQRDSAGGLVSEDDIVIGTARYDQLVGAPNTVKLFRTTDGTGAVKDRLRLDQNVVTIPAGLLRMTDAQAVPVTTINTTSVFGAFKYDEFSSVNSSGHVFRDTDSLGVSVDSMVVQATTATFSGVVSTGNAVVVPPSAWNNTVLVDGVLTSIYTSPALAIGTYLINAQASVNCALGFLSYEAMYIDELAHAYEDITNIGAGGSTEIVLKWSQIFKVTALSNDTFGLLVRCSGNGALNLIECAALNTGVYGFVEYIKIA